MEMEAILAAVAVADIDQSIVWYTQLFGRGCDDRPMKEAAEWRLTNSAGIQLVLDKERAGQSMVTLGVPDIERLASELTSRGLSTRATAPGNGLFRLAQIHDPDGNVLTFAQDQRSR